MDSRPDWFNKSSGWGGQSVLSWEIKQTGGGGCWLVGPELSKHHSLCSLTPSHRGSRVGHQAWCQCSPLSLVEECRGSALIGPEMLLRQLSYAIKNQLVASKVRKIPIDIRELAEQHLWTSERRASTR